MGFRKFLDEDKLTELNISSTSTLAKKFKKFVKTYIMPKLAIKEEKEEETISKADVLSFVKVGFLKKTGNNVLPTLRGMGSVVGMDVDSNKEISLDEIKTFMDKKTNQSKEKQLISYKTIIVTCKNKISIDTWG